MRELLVAVPVEPEHAKRVGLTGVGQPGQLVATLVATASLRLNRLAAVDADVGGCGFGKEEGPSNWATRNKEWGRALIANSPKGTMLPVLWMILARIYANDGEYEKSYRQPKDVSVTMPGADGFWDFLAEMDQMGLVSALKYSRNAT